MKKSSKVCDLRGSVMVRGKAGRGGKAKGGAGSRRAHSDAGMPPSSSGTAGERACCALLSYYPRHLVLVLCEDIHVGDTVTTLCKIRSQF